MVCLLQSPRLIASKGTLLAEKQVPKREQFLSKENETMIMTNKLLPVALVAALIGGSVGAFVMHSSNTSAETQRTTLDTSRNPDVQYAQYQADVSGREQIIPAAFNTSAEQTAYKSGFADGFRSCESGVAGSQVSSG